MDCYGWRSRPCGDPVMPCDVGDCRPEDCLNDDCADYRAWLAEEEADERDLAEAMQQWRQPE